MDYFTSLAEWAHAGVENSLSVVIPVHDEEDNLKQTMTELEEIEARLPYQITWG